jgi:hypothetical protein
MSPVLDHAFGERYDSPVPLALFLLAGAAVVLASFALVAGRSVAPPAQDYDAARDDVVRRHVGRVWSLVSVVTLGLLVVVGLVGTEEVARNLLPVAFWLVVWVVVPLVVGLAGDVTQRLNPFAAIAQATDRPGLRQAVLGSPTVLPWPKALGWWAFAALYTLVVVGELVVNETATLPSVVAVGLLLYAVVCAAGGLVFGAGAFTTRAEVFTVMFASWGRLGLRRHGAPGPQGLGGGLEVPFQATAGRLVSVLLLLVSVAYDGLLSTPHWSRLVGALPTPLRTGPGYVVFAVAALVLFALVMLTVFGLFAQASARAGGHSSSAAGSSAAGSSAAGSSADSTRLVPALTGLAPSLLPIAYGYLLAHYLQYVLVNGQLLLPLIGNPVGQDWWPIHLPYPFDATFTPDPRIMPTSLLWYLQIVVIVAAHVVAVLLAHRHLVRQARDAVAARRSEWPWLAAMVGYTMVSLWLLAQPLVAEH